MRENPNSASEEHPAKENSFDKTKNGNDTWEYKVIHINVNNNKQQRPSNPSAASKKLQGTLSPEFISQQFPEVYKKKTIQGNHPAQQLEGFLNQMGNQGWELLEISEVGGPLFFFFKRLKRDTAGHQDCEETTEPKEAEEVVTMPKKKNES